MRGLVFFLGSLVTGLLPAGVANIILRPHKVAWLVYPRNWDDLIKRIPVLKIFPNKIVLLTSKSMGPFVVSRFSDGSTGVDGYVIGIPLVLDQLMSDKTLAVRRVNQALALAKKLGAEKISLAGYLTSIVTKNQLDKKHDVEIYDGTQLLSMLVARKVSQVIQEKKLEKSKLTLGIIGATTNLGEQIAQLVTFGFNKIIIFGKTLGHLEKLRTKLQSLKLNSNIEISTNLKEVSKCDINILSSYINVDDPIENYIKSNSIFIGAMEPISPFAIKLKDKRRDVKTYLGVAISTPAMRYHDYDFGLPEGNSFVCLTEALVMNKNDVKNLKDPNVLLERFNFRPVWTAEKKFI